jgi:hypothetical protein
MRDTFITFIDRPGYLLFNKYSKEYFTFSYKYNPDILLHYDKYDSDFEMDYNDRPYVEDAEMTRVLQGKQRLHGNFVVLRLNKNEREPEQPQTKTTVRKLQF